MDEALRSTLVKDIYFGCNLHHKSIKNAHVLKVLDLGLNLLLTYPPGERERGNLKLDKIVNYITILIVNFRFKS